MTQIDKKELKSLKTVLTSIKVENTTILRKILSDINLSLSYESILICRNLNELFLCVNTYKSINTEDFSYVKDKLITQINLVIDEC